MAFQIIIKLSKFLKALEEDSKMYVFLPMATDVRDYLIVLVHPVYERSLFMILSKLKNIKRLRMLGVHVAAAFLANSWPKEQVSWFVIEWPLAKDAVANPKWTGC